MEDLIMRKSIYFAGLAAIAAISFSSCSKNEVDTPETPTTFTHTVTIKAEAPKTRTEIVEGTDQATFKWSENDASRFTVKENNTAGTDVGLTLSNENTTGVLNATFETETAETYVYSAFMAANLTGKSGDADRKPKIPAIQNPSSTSYDPDADVLVAKPLSFTDPQDELTMQFARPVVINKMTLKGLTPDETVSNVVISGGDKQIVGYYNVGSETWTGQGNEITVNVNRTLLSDVLVVYFVSMPVEDVTLTVTATTSENIYSKTFTKTINFVENEVTVFGVSGLTKTEKEDYSGTYVLTNSDGNKMAKAWNDGNNLPATDVAMEDGVIYYDPDVVNPSTAQITLTKVTDEESEYYGMYTMMQNGKYLYAAGSANNYLKAQANASVNAYWEISCTGGVWSIVATKSSNRNVLRFNDNLFSCYSSTSTGESPVLFDATDIAPTPVITASDISIESNAVTSTNTGATFNSNTGTVTAAAYDDSELTTTSTWLTVSVSDKSVSYAATANETEAERTAYIKITATNSDGRSVSKTITVTQAFYGATYETWTLIDKAEDLTAGDYIMCAVVGNKYHAWTGSISSSQLVTEEVTYDEHKELTFENATTVTLISKGSNQYVIKYLSGTYVDYLASSNATSLKYVTSEANGEVWTVSNASTGVFLTGGTNSGVIKSATTATSRYIRSYASSNTGKVGVVFFKKDN